MLCLHTRDFYFTHLQILQLIFTSEQGEHVSMIGNFLCKEGMEQTRFF